MSAEQTSRYRHGERERETFTLPGLQDQTLPHLLQVVTLRAEGFRVPAQGHCKHSRLKNDHASQTSSPKVWKYSPEPSLQRTSYTYDTCIISYHYRHSHVWRILSNTSSENAEGFCNPLCFRVAFQLFHDSTIACIQGCGCKDFFSTGSEPNKSN